MNRCNKDSSLRALQRMITRGDEESAIHVLQFRVTNNQPLILIVDQTKIRFNPLVMAVYYNRLAVVDWLLSAESSSVRNLRNAVPKPYSLMWYAVWNSHPETVRRIWTLRHGQTDKFLSDCFRCLKTHAGPRSAETLLMMVELGVDVPIELERSAAICASDRAKAYYSEFFTAVLESASFAVKYLKLQMDRAYLRAAFQNQTIRRFVDLEMPMTSSQLKTAFHHQKPESVL